MAEGRVGVAGVRFETDPDDRVILATMERPEAVLSLNGGGAVVVAFHGDTPVWEAERARFERVIGRSFADLHRSQHATD